MPAKFTHTEEYCYPCKYHHQQLIMSGLHPIYHMHCKHPKVTENYELTFTREKGRFIGENDENRPQWCPIRGNKEAEAEAERDE